MTGQGKLDANRPLFFRRRTIVYHKGQNRIRQSAVRQGDSKYLRTYKRDASGLTEEYEGVLYNLKDDLAETKDLAQSKPEKLQELKKGLEDWEAEMAETAAVFPTKKKTDLRGNENDSEMAAFSRSRCCNAWMLNRGSGEQY